MDLGKRQITFKCPDCEFINSVALADVVAEASIVCVGCLKTIQLQDGIGSTKRAVNDVNDAINKLKDTLNGH